MINTKTRLDRIAKIISDICDIDCNTALEIVLNTDTGQAILNNNKDVLYEQITDNIYTISKELKPCYKNLTELLKPKAISDSYKRIIN